MPKLKHLMSPNPVVIHVDHPLREAALRMREAGVGALPVVDGDELVGMVADRDLVVRSLPEGGGPDTPVGAAMTRHVVALREDAPIGAAAAAMVEHRVRRLAVVDRDRVLVGMLSLTDLAGAGLQGCELAAVALRVVSAPIATAKTPAREDPTGGRARRSPAGAPHVYAPQPRIKRNGVKLRAVKN
jgi:CBS domain-containing protein